jgi:predicted PurR-regulated permease PerM
LVVCWPDVSALSENKDGGVNITFTHRVLFIAGVGLLALSFLYAFTRAPDIFFLTFISVVIAVFLHTVAGALPLPQKPALGVTLLLIVGVLSGFSWLVGPRLDRQLQGLNVQLPRTVDQIERQLSQTAWGERFLARVPVLSTPTPAQASTPGGPEREGGRLSGLVVNLLSRLTELLTVLFSALSHIFFVIFMSIFFAAGASSYATGATHLFPHARRDHVRSALGEIYRTLQGWLLGQFVAMLTVGTVVGLALWLLGVPFALALGFITFLLEFIPTIGPWLAGVPAVLVALSQGIDTALLVVGLFFVGELLEGNILLPLVQRWAVELPPALTLFAIFLLGALFGFVGVLVAAPLAATLLTLVKMLYLKDTFGDKVSLPGKG